MRKLVAFTAVWLAAAAVAVVVAWQGVGIVTNQVTDDRPAPLAAGEVRALTAEAEGRGARGSTTPADPTAPTDATADTAPATAGTDPATTPPANGATPERPGGPPPTTTPTPTPATPTTTGPPTTTPAPAEAPAETRTYNLVGGSVALRFASTGVTVVWATPAAGFEVGVEPEHGNGVRVEFESDDHRSRVTGWWDGGPLDEAREDER